jgi:hypothetical protein
VARSVLQRLERLPGRPERSPPPSRSWTVTATSISAPSWPVSSRRPRARPSPSCARPASWRPTARGSRMPRSATPCTASCPPPTAPAATRAPPGVWRPPMRPTTSSPSTCWPRDRATTRTPVGSCARCAWPPRARASAARRPRRRRSCGAPSTSPCPPRPAARSWRSWDGRRP